MLRLFLFSIFLVFASVAPVKADSMVVQTCGTLPKAYAPGATRVDTVDVNGNKCIGSAAGGGTFIPYQYTPLTPGQYTPVSDSAATGLTVPTGATYAVVCFEGANHRFAWDGTTTPTASVGTLVGFGPGVCVPLSGAATLTNFKTISVSAGGTFTASFAK